MCCSFLFITSVTILFLSDLVEKIDLKVMIVVYFTGYSEYYNTSGWSNFSVAKPVFVNSLHFFVSFSLPIEMG